MAAAKKKAGSKAPSKVDTSKFVPKKGFKPTKPRPWPTRTPVPMPQWLVEALRSFVTCSCIEIVDGHAANHHSTPGDEVCWCNKDQVTRTISFATGSWPFEGSQGPIVLAPGECSGYFKVRGDASSLDGYSYSINPGTAGGPDGPTVFVD